MGDELWTPNSDDLNVNELYGLSVVTSDHVRPGEAYVYASNTSSNSWHYRGRAVYLSLGDTYELDPAKFLGVGSRLKWEDGHHVFAEPATPPTLGDAELEWSKAYWLARYEVGFETEAIKNVAARLDLLKHVVVLDVDIVDSEWEPTFEIPIEELRKLPGWQFLDEALSRCGYNYGGYVEHNHSLWQQVIWSVRSSFSGSGHVAISGLR